MEIELTTTRQLKVWWLVIWRGTLIALPAGFVAGATVGAIVGILRLPIIHNPNLLRSLGQFVGFLVGLPIYYLVIGMALRKKYRDFRLGAFPLEAPQLATPSSSI